MLDPSAAAIRRAEAAVRAGVPEARRDPARPACHFRPPARWMNDPNGTIHHRGWYHLFYQHNPFGDEWGEMHWGHARSRDLVRWEHLPVALAPTPEAGEAHCFSGCAWKDAAGRPVLFYSSFPEGEGRPAEQWIVRCDDALARFEKPASNPVLSLEDPDVPVFGPEWRDPFVFEEEGRTFLILGATLDGEAVVPLWEAADGSLERWRYRGILHRSPAGEVDFFECPGLLRVGDRHVLAYSAHRPVEYLCGSFDPAAGTFEPRRRGRLDHSPNLYATSFFAAEPGGRPVLVAWVRGWPGGRGWNGTLGLPRLLEPAADGGVRQRPLDALAELRDADAGESLAPESVLDDGSLAVGPPAASLEVRAVVALREARAWGLRLRRAADGETVATVRLEAGREAGDATGRPLRARIEGRTLRFRLRAGEPPAAGAGAGRPAVTEIPLPATRPDDAVEVRAFWDRSLLEVFLDGGREACTLVLDARGEPVRAEAFAEGGAARARALEAWPLEAIW